MATDGVPVQCFGVGRAIIAGRFTTVGSGDPTVVVGEGFTVARTATGRYTVTLTATPAPSQIISVVAQAAPETLTNELVEVWVDQDSITNLVFEIRLEVGADTSAAATALADDTGAEIHFICMVQIAGSNND